MMDSHQHVVDYMTPLGLHHLMGEGHHYGPAPWVEGGPRADWTSVYFHRATRDGVGFDRSSRGSDAVSQYAPPVAKVFDDPQQVPESLLLWFHHVRWDHRLQSGRTLWDELVHRYTLGVQGVSSMREQWAALAPRVDAERHAHVRSFLRIQEQEAQWWRDACIAYFQRFSGMPIPEGHAPPAHSLEHYQSLEFPYAPGH
jgi:alpha-glucuronidase